MVILGIVVCAVLFAVGTPLYVAFGAGGLIIILFYAGFGISQLAAMYFDTINSFTLLALPLFILAGSLMVQGGISKPLIELFRSFTARVPGGLAVASIVASAFIGAMTGAAFATLAMVGLVMFPAMIEARYDRGYSAGVLSRPV
jgi:C4-dicarboxylate transporter DctM subunit